MKVHKILCLLDALRHSNTGAVIYRQVERMAVIGLAAGSIPKQYVRVFPNVQVDGIELDAGIVEAGYDYFELADEQINVIVGDGRYELNRLTGEYDVIKLSIINGIILH